MLDMPSPGSFPNLGLLIWAQQGSEYVKPCGSNWVKINGAQLKINLHSPSWPLRFNGLYLKSYQELARPTLIFSLQMYCSFFQMQKFLFHKGVQQIFEKIVFSSQNKLLWYELNKDKILLLSIIRRCFSWSCCTVGQL